MSGEIGSSPESAEFSGKLSKAKLNKGNLLHVTPRGVVTVASKAISAGSETLLEELYV